MNVIFVGISSKSDSKGQLVPLDVKTPSGQIIAKIDEKLNSKSLKTNLVNFTPLDKTGKIRYPNMKEIKDGIKELKKYLKTNSPCLVFMLGKIVEKSVLKEFDNDKEIKLVAIKHPSYIHVYKRYLTDDYVKNVLETIIKHSK